MKNTLEVANKSTLNNIDVSGAVSMMNTLSVDGAATLSGLTYINSNVDISGSMDVKSSNYLFGYYIQNIRC